ncbi:MAG: chemotaxis protein CheW [Myxococcaceae bacterium]|nr:chemotaxis protein CheW [Myxococcaceae bacterium]MCI0673266.1 chemotaxis protein CheW [Myxococcaceae bacterium]
MSPSPGDAAARSGTDAERLVRFLEEAAPAREAPAPHVERLALLQIRLEGDAFALPLLQVLEVVRPGPLTRVPAAPEHVRGLMNLRGRILPVLELRTRLGLSAAVHSPLSRVVVVERQQRRFGLWVDEALGVLQAPRSTLAAPPPEVRSPLSDYVSATLPLPSGMALVLDIERLLLLRDAPPPSAG